MTSEADDGISWLLPHSVVFDRDGAPQLEGGACANCGNVVFPKPKVCANCWSETIEAKTLATTGVLYAYTILHVARKGWQTPYAVSYVDLDDGVRVSAPLNYDPDDLPKMDSRVRLQIKEVSRSEDGGVVMSHCFEVIDGGSDA